MGIVASCTDELTSQRVESSAASGHAAPPPEPGARAARPLTAATSSQGIGGAMVAAQLAGQSLLLIADGDARSLRLVDARTHGELANLALRGTPAQVVVAGDGRAYVTLRDANLLVALEVKQERGLALAEVASIPVEGEPFGLAVTPSGDTLLVTSAWGARLTALSLPAGETLFALDVPREPRAVAVTRDGRHALVSHAVGAQVTRVSLADRTDTRIELAGVDDAARRLVADKAKQVALQDCALRSTRQWSDELQGVLCSKKEQPLERWLISGEGVRQVAAARGKDAVWPNLRAIRGAPHSLTISAVVAHERGAAQGFAIAALGDALLIPAVLTHLGPPGRGSYGMGQILPAHEPLVIDVRGDALRLRVESAAHAPDEPRRTAERGSRECLLPRAAASDGERLFVACLGTNRVLAYDGAATGALSQSFAGRLEVPAGPTGLAVDLDEGVLHVWSQFAHTLSTVRLAAFSPLAAAPITPERTARLDDRAPDRGRDLFHASGDPRIAGDGRACASCHVDGRDDALAWPTPDGLRQTPMLAGRLGADTRPYGWQGSTATLEEHLGHTFARLRGTGLRGDDSRALVDYLQRLPLPAPLAAPPALAARGKELFFAPGVGCATCHRAATGSDGARHDVGSGAALDTPSLRFVSGTAPYFHDGRYATLRDLLADTKGKMGWAAAPAPEDLAALEAYLRTL
jgi:mono/diheme cytochrome c family protein